MRLNFAVRSNSIDEGLRDIYKYFLLWNLNKKCKVEVVFQYGKAYVF